MAGAYDDRDGTIWMDGQLVPWRDANVHILTHAMHYASSVFEGERCYSGKIFKSRAHSERLIKSGQLIDFDIPYTVDEIEAAKQAALDANGLTDAYVRPVAWRGSGGWRTGVRSFWRGRIRPRRCGLTPPCSKRR